MMQVRRSPGERIARHSYLDYYLLSFMDLYFETVVGPYLKVYRELPRKHSSVRSEKVANPLQAFRRRFAEVQAPVIETRT